MKRWRTLLVTAALLVLPTVIHAQVQVSPTAPGATLIQNSGMLLDAATAAAHSHTTGATITITAPSNQFIYITGWDLSNCEGSAVTAAAPTYITTTGLTGSPQFQAGSGPATAGTCSPTIAMALSRPFKSTTAGTNVTFVLPSFVTNQVLSLNVYYFLGP